MDTFYSFCLVFVPKYTRSVTYRAEDIRTSSRCCVRMSARDITSARMEVNQFNDRTWILSALCHFIVIPNELTSGTDVPRLSARALLKSVSQEDHLVGGESRLVATNVVGGASVAN
jgi:hypothetical protein